MEKSKTTTLIIMKTNYLISLINLIKYLKLGQQDVEETFDCDGDAEKYINNYFDLNPERSLAKFLDEYYWARYTGRWKIPPEWDTEILQNDDINEHCL